MPPEDNPADNERYVIDLYRAEIARFNQAIETLRTVVRETPDPLTMSVYLRQVWLPQILAGKQPALPPVLLGDPKFQTRSTSR